MQKNALDSIVCAPKNARSSLAVGKSLGFRCEWDISYFMEHHVWKLDLNLASGNF
jgi:hypothetical protein